MPLLENVARKTKAATKAATQKAKLKTQNLVLQRQKTQRLKQFGIEAYDCMSILTTSQDFYAQTNIANVTSSCSEDNDDGKDQDLTNSSTIAATSTTQCTTTDSYGEKSNWLEVIQPILLKADKEIRAYDNKSKTAQESIEVVQQRREVDRQHNQENPANNWKEKLGRAAQSSQLAGNQAKLKTHLAVARKNTQHVKEQFGLELFVVLGPLFNDVVDDQANHDAAADNDASSKNSEDSHGWFSSQDVTSHPPVIKKKLRGVYDACAADLGNIQKQIVANKEIIDSLSSYQYSED